MKSFIILVVTNNHFFLFAFLWKMALVCIPVYNSESYEYFRCVFVDVYVIKFCKGYLFPMKFYKKIYLHGKFITEYYFFFYSHTCSLGWINSLLQKNIYITCLIKRKSFRFSHCIFQSVYALNTPSIKILRRSVVKVLFTLLVKQLFRTYWLVINWEVWLDKKFGNYS